MKKIALILMVIALLLFASGCSKQQADSNKVLIYASSNDDTIQLYQKRLAEQFPQYEVTIEYMASGNLAAKLLAEGKATQCDIAYDMDNSQLPKLFDLLADLSAYDSSIFMEDMLLPGNKALPDTRSGGCIAINPDVLAAKGVPEPTSYQDLLKPEYKGLLSMPNPKSSGTGYMFLKSLVNTWGEEAAFAYFDGFAQNVLQFTSSGSAPVAALKQGEAGIALCMTAQTVTEINNGTNLKILYFAEGSPSSAYSMAMIDGKQKRQAVKDVFDFLYNTLVAEDKALFFPEKIYKDKDFVIENYPVDIVYADMSNNTASEKERLLEKWKY